MNIRTYALAALGTAAVLLATLDASSPPSTSAAGAIARGRALVIYGTCNDCHTAAWRDTDGAVPVSRWMTGSSVGFRGWWGTSYPTNVRLDFQVMSVDRWIAAVRTRAGHPPMVWQDLRQLPDGDLRASTRSSNRLDRPVRRLQPRSNRGANRRLRSSICARCRRRRHSNYPVRRKARQTAAPLPPLQASIAAVSHTPARANGEGSILASRARART
jgi:hypothetical protein